MTATEGAMNESSFLSTVVEEPESINFHDSLRFFQQQLNLNGGGFPTPSSIQIHNSDINSKLNCQISNVDDSDNQLFETQSVELENRTKSMSNCRISIPTVDSILESVRVLRAIQKSQEQRGTSWSLNKVLSNVDQNLQNPPSLQLIQNTLLNNISENKMESAKSEGNFVTDNCDYRYTDSNSEPITKNLNNSNETAHFWPSSPTCEHKESDKDSSNTQINIIKNILKTEETLFLNGSDDIRNSDFALKKECSSILVNTHNTSDMEKSSTELNKRGISPDSNSKALKRNGFDFSNCCEKQQNVPKHQALNESEVDFIVNCDTTQKNEYKLLANGINVVKDEKCPQRLTSTNSTNFSSELGIDSSSSCYVSSECSSCASPNHVLDSSSGYSSSAYTNHSVKDETKNQTLPNEWTTEWLESRVASEFDESKTPKTTTPFTAEFDGNNLCQEVLVSEKSNNEDSLNSEDIANGEVDVAQTKNTNDTPTEISQLTSSNDENNRTDKSLETTQQLQSVEAIDETGKSAERIEYDERLNKYEEFTDTIQQIQFNGQLHYKDDETRSLPSSLTVEVSEDQEIIQIVPTGKQNGGFVTNNLEAPCDSNSNGIADNLFSNEVKIELNTNKSNKNRDINDIVATKKFITSSWDLVSIVKLLYKIKEPQAPKVFPEDHTIKIRAYILSKGIFSQQPEAYYNILVKDLFLYVIQEEEIHLFLPLTYAKIHLENGTTLIVDNKMGRCLHLKCETHEELITFKEELQLHCDKCWQSECINLVHYPLKCHQNIIVIDLGSCSTRAGLLMDQPTLPTLFFPSVCAKNKITGNHVYGSEALHPEARQNSTMSFPLRPSVKIIKHSLDIKEVTGIFKKIFKDLRVDPDKYTVLVCLPRSLSTNAQNALVKVLLDDLNVQSVSLSHQAILTMYAHNVSTGIVVDIGDRMDIVPVIDGFVVDGGVTRLPYGGQRLIHHMKHALAQKHISLSNDLDSFVVQFITENLTYIAEDYDKENEVATLFPEAVRKSVDLQTFALDVNCLQSAVLDDARFKVPEGLFNPDLWGLDCLGVHKLVQKAIQAACVDSRKTLAENIFVSGGVTMIPGFVERLRQEVTKLNAPRIIPQVHASQYRYHCTYIGACRFARMDVFPRVCVNRQEYSKDGASSLKKFMLCV